MLDYNRSFLQDAPQAGGKLAERIPQHGEELLVKIAFFENFGLFTPPANGKLLGSPEGLYLYVEHHLQRAALY